jgi:hypothetical protein
MRNRVFTLVGIGVVATGLCAVLAITALGSTSAAKAGTGTAQALEYAQPLAADKSPADKSPADKSPADKSPADKPTADKPTADKPTADNGKATSKSGMSEENQQLLKIQYAIKATVVGPTAAQVTEAGRLVKRLKADGRATPDQLAWLALSAAEKRVQAAPVGTN